MKTYKILRKSCIAIALFFTIIGFSQTQSTTIPVESFYSKIKEQKNAQVIDARGPEEFALNHIHGAVNFNQQ